MLKTPIRNQTVHTARNICAMEVTSVKKCRPWPDAASETRRLVWVYTFCICPNVPFRMTLASYDHSRQISHTLPQTHTPTEYKIVMYKVSADDIGCLTTLNPCSVFKALYQFLPFIVNWNILAEVSLLSLAWTMPSYRPVCEYNIPIKLLSVWLCYGFNVSLILSQSYCDGARMRQVTVLSHWSAPV